MFSATSIYRSTLREASYLPHPYLQSFVKGRARDYFKRHRHAEEPSKYLQRAVVELRRLQRANRGEHKPFMNILRQAFGRSGKLKHELLKIHLAQADPTVEPRPPIIPNVDRSRPPSYTNTLLALAGSTLSKRTGKEMKPNEFLNPRQLPARANPDSEEAQMLGPLSLRRVKNIHWRHYSEQIRRIYPPLAVNTSIPAEKIKEMGVHIPFTGLEEFDPIKMLNKLASVQSGQGRGTSSPMKVGRRPARWLRRRYQEVLGMTPSVTVDLNLATETLQKGNKETSKDKPQSKSGLREKEATNGLGHIKTKVSIRESSKLALRSPNKCREVTLDELEWIKRGNNRR